MTVDIKHGKPSSYNNHKCRCELCTAAWSEYIYSRGYVKKYRAKQRQQKIEGGEGNK
jgi:hypothetical protein